MDMNLFVTLDERYLDPLRVMLYSLCKSNPRHRFTVYLLHSSLEQEHIALAEANLPPGQCTLVSVRVPKEKFQDLPCSERWPVEASYRIFAAQLLPETLERALYLDPDIVVINDLEKLYTLDFENNFFAAASHMFIQMQIISWYRFDMKRGSQYINSGVMLFNLALLRKEQNTREVYRFIEQYRKRLVLFDQDILNGVYHRRTKYISPLQYNLDEKYYNMYNMNPYVFFNRVDIPWVKRNTVIIHFNGKNKPWNRRYRGQFKREFYDPVAGEALRG